ncbi:MAG TPA: response regulator [Thermoanaerobaculia bacterium]|nr:response regulator [Thermoanaerobaculia bacterium]
MSEVAGKGVRTSVSSQLLHDLRSPLNQIIGYSEILSEEAQGEHREASVVDLQRVREAGYRMLALIEENFTVRPEQASARPIVRPVAAVPEEGVAASLPPADLPRGMATAPGLLLVVDDDAMNRDVLSRRLERQGHRVHNASSGAMALQLMQENAFEVVLLDIMMPDMDGYEVLGHLKADERLQHVPVIMISAIDEVQSVVRCIEAGAEDYLAKPFDPTLLKARIGASLEKKRGRDRESVLYEQLQKNYRRLEELEKLRDDMRNMIVHDLRTPLTAVIVGVEMLGSHGELSASQRDMIKIAAGGGKTLLGMINDLLDVEKMESGTSQLRYERLSAAALIAGAMEQVGSLAEMEGTALVIELRGDLLFSGDENKLSRTLVNLIGNAIKFTHAGTVTVSASHDGAGSIRFAVRDTGAGIPPEAFERIFEKFGQLDAGNRVGTGLGLAFCKLAVEAHGGRIGVESTPGVGSTFSFTVPVVESR